MTQSFREIYDKMSVEEYYENGRESIPYVNHHEPEVQKLLLENLPNLTLGHVLDLACGDGLVTNVIKNFFGKDAHYAYILGCDPYTAKEYRENTGRPCVELSFKDLVVQGFKGLGYGLGYKTFSCIICSFGLHLCEKSMLPDLTWRLSEISDTLVVISPSKYPYLGEPKVEKFALTSQRKRVHYKVYDLPILWHTVKEMGL